MFVIGFLIGVPGGHRQGCTSSEISAYSKSK